MNKLVKVWTIGRISYENGLKLQKYVINLHRTRKNDLNNTILLLEHDPVYTIGIRRKNYSKDDEMKLRKLGADFYETNRGGLITFHGPGQLVAYPIIDLKQFKPSVRWYVSAIERSIITTCATFGIIAHTSPHTGVWVKERKICALGLHASRYVTSHGLALNCATDLAWYDHIVPCGIPDKGVTSVTNELNRNVTIDEVSPVFIKSFAEVFECEYFYEPVDQDLLKKIFNE